MKYVWSGLVALTITLLVPSVSAEGIKVFLLAGQSNMEGFGRIGNDADVQGTLPWMAANQSLKDEFPILIDDNNNWVITESNGDWAKREDVWIYYDRLYDNKNINNHKVLTGGLAVRYGFTDNAIGPEFGFGHVMGEFYDEPVLLIKTCWGGRSLYNDFLPPSAEDYPTPIKNGDKGFMYKRILDDAKKVLGNLNRYFPEYADEGFEIVGFCWHQGWNDGRNVTVAQQYEELMITFIEDIRNDLNREFGSAPDLPFVIASSGFNGFTPVSDPWQKRLQDYVAPAQLAAAAKTENCLGVDTRPFYRVPAQSPQDAVYHWNFSAESYFRIGYGMAEAMKELLAAKTARIRPVNR